MTVSDHELTELFYHVVRRLDRLAKSSQRNVNFFSGQYKCLFLLDQAESVTQHRLANILEIRPASLSELLSKLEKKGFVSKTLSAKDRRTYDISITPSGRSEVQKVRSQRLKDHHELTDPLSEEDKRQLHAILKKIDDYYTNLEEL